jgi:uroporphyrinogen-III synthase
MTGSLAALKIVVPETRELDLFVSMLETEGAIAFRCPLVRILDLEDTRDADTWIAQLIAGTFRDTIWLTGEGLRRLAAIATNSGKREAFIAALSLTHIVIRGPKPARALRELGLTPSLAAATPTSQGVMGALATEDIKGRKIGVQLYPGEGAKPLLEHLHGRGAVLFPVTPYRYASEADTDRVKQIIRDMAAGLFDMIAFTSTPQVERLVDVARETGLEKDLREALLHIRVAAIGPVVEEALHRLGITTLIRPETSFHLKPFVRSIAANWATR